MRIRGHQELAEVSGPAWPHVKQLVAEAAVPVRVMPPPVSRIAVTCILPWARSPRPAMASLVGGSGPDQSMSPARKIREFR